MKFPSANGYDVFMRDVILSRRNRPRSRFSRFVRRMFQANCLLEKDENGNAEGHFPQTEDYLRSFSFRVSAW